MHHHRPVEELGAPSSVLAPRLALTPDGPTPTLEELGLEPAKVAAFAWQDQRSRAAWIEFCAHGLKDNAADWVPEILGIFGVVGEQVLVAVEAEAEKELLTRNLGATPTPSRPEQAAAARALRFFAEGQGNAVVIAGHGVANLTVRTLALDPSFALPANKLGMKNAADFAPQSGARNAWLSLTDETVQALVVAASPCSQQMKALAGLAEDLRLDPPFRALVELRNTQYHRWRGESPGVTGINWRADTTRQREERGESVGLSGQLPDYTEGQPALDEVVETSRAALDALVARMPNILATWGAAVGPAL